MDKDTLYTNFKQLKQMSDELIKDVNERCKIKDVCKLLDLKASIKYVDSKLTLHSTDISHKLRKDEYEEDKKRVHSVLDVLIQENLLGKWVWKSGEVREN